MLGTQVGAAMKELQHLKVVFHVPRVLKFGCLDFALLFLLPTFGLRRASSLLRGRCTVQNHHALQCLSTTSPSFDARYPLATPKVVRTHPSVCTA